MLRPSDSTDHWQEYSTLTHIVRCSPRAIFLLRTRRTPPSFIWSWLVCFTSCMAIGPCPGSRNSHPITPYAPTGAFEYKSVVEKLRTKVEESLLAQMSPGLPDGRCFQADICQPWPRDMCNIDGVITSPPFFDSTRFYMTNWMRYWFCGWARPDFDTQTNNFVESMQKKSLDVYRGYLHAIFGTPPSGRLCCRALGIQSKVRHGKRACRANR